MIGKKRCANLMCLKTCNCACGNHYHYIIVIVIINLKLVDSSTLFLWPRSHVGKINTMIGIVVARSAFELRAKILSRTSIAAKRQNASDVHSHLTNQVLAFARGLPLGL